MSSPLFSILIPCYNVENHVVECVHSIIRQSFTDWEVVAVDDGSTDGTWQRMQDLRRFAPEKIQLLHKDNGGQLLARREALSMAKGQYVVYLDSDDALRADALELICCQIEKSPGSLVQFKLSSNADFSNSILPAYPSGLNCPTCKDIEWLRKRVCEGNTFNNLCGKAIPRRLLAPEEEFKGYSFVKNGEDLLQLVRVLDKAERVVLLDEPLYFYRMNPDSITHTFQPLFYESVKAVNQELRSVAAGWNDPELDHLLKVRWINSSVSAIWELHGSDYPCRQLQDKIYAICCESAYERAIQEVPLGELSRKAKVITALAKRRYYFIITMMVMAQRAKSRLERPKQQ